MNQPIEFETRAQRRARQRAERKQPQPKESPRRWVWVSALTLLILGGGAWFLTRPKPTEAQKVEREAKSRRQLVLSCTTDMATTFHIHAHLTIMIDGQEQTIPADTGITSACMHPLHTHDATGIIHIESPTQKDFTLGDFFAVWGKDFSATKVLDTIIDDQHRITTFVDGHVVTTGADTVLRDRESIAIVVSAKDAIVKPPDNYIFPNSL